MAKGLIKWDEQGKHFYETGISNGVLYTMNDDGEYEAGVAWNGLTSVSESPEGAEATAIYADNIKYLNLISAEEFKGTIEAYTYPDEFAECDGSAELASGVLIGQQARKKFGLVYKTNVGSDTNSELGYKIHVVYNCTASPSERSYSTINDSPEAITFSWEFNTTPVEVTGKKPTATVVIDTTKLDATGKAKLQTLEDKLFGSGTATDGTEPTLILPDEIVSILTTPVVA